MSQGGEILEGLLDRVNNKADLSVFLQCAMTAFDGPAGLAKFLREEFDQLNAGSAGRIKILTTIIELMKQHTPDDEDFTPEEESAMEQYLKSGGANGDHADLL
jgi:hypothetical protein